MSKIIHVSVTELRIYVEMHYKSPMKMIQEKIDTEIDNNIFLIQVGRIVVFWPTTRPKMPFQGDTPEGSDTF